MSLDLGENTLFLVTLNLSSVMLLGSSSLSMCLYSTLHLFIRYYSSLALLHSVSATADFSLSLVVSEISSHCCQSAVHTGHMIVRVFSVCMIVGSTLQYKVA